MSRYWLGLLLSAAALGGAGYSRIPSESPAQLHLAGTQLQLPPGPDRFTVLTVEYTAYLWWMVRWEDQAVVCSVEIDHDGLPTVGEVLGDCGDRVSRKWWNQDACASTRNRQCDGYYTYLVDSWPAQKQIPVHLAQAAAWLELEDCEPVASGSTSICEAMPVLVITGQEPLPNESILEIAGTIDGEPFSCPGTSSCRLPLFETDEDGVPIEFWAYSTYGDSSQPFTGQVRVQSHDEGDPDQVYWYVDVLSSQWQGGPVATCAQSWDSFPPVGGPPTWLTTPPATEELSSDIPYAYLAANLILQGAVNAGACPDGGLDPSGQVNQCGLEAARPVIEEWQNRFDQLILDTAVSTEVPARLLKNLFARESQFWPGVYQGAADVGLGQLTENGADTTLFWNRSFYAQFCPLVLASETCGSGYLHLGSDDQAALRRALVASVDATCETCPLGLDLSQADFSVRIFAHTMLANCEQAGRVVRNLTGKPPGEVASYEDLWRFTLVNYNAGAGCLAEAIRATRAEGMALDWPAVSAFLSPACQGAVDYVEDISQ